MRRDRIAWALAAVACTVGVAASAPRLVRAQQNSKPASGVIAGRVVDAVTGEPVPRATVTLSWITPERRVARPGERPGQQVTNDLGQFEYASLAAGKFRLVVRRSGYLQTTWGMQAPWDSGAAYRVEQELRPDEQVTDLVIKVWPSGSISGTVRDELGEPIVKATVQLLKRYRFGAGEGRWGPTAIRTGTDDRGMYRLGTRAINLLEFDSLPGPGPGDYVVVATPAPPKPGEVPAFAGAVFAPTSRSAARAQVIALGVGEHRSGVDVVVPTGPRGVGFPVAGRIVSGVMLRAPVRVRLLPQDVSGELEDFEALATTADALGRFAFAAVPAGDYRLRTWQFPAVGSEGAETSASGGARIPGGYGRPLPPIPSAPTWVADVPVHVEGAIDDLAVPMQVAARFTGRVIFDGQTPSPAGNELLAIPVPVRSDREIGAMPLTRIESDGRFTSAGLPPGRYRIFPDIRLRHPDRPTEILWSASSIRVEGREFDAGPIPLGTTDLDVTITLTDRRAEVTGTVRDSRGQVRPDARVIVFVRGSASTSGCLRLVAPDRLGRFQSSLARSGDCLLAAVMNPPEAWQTLEYLKSLEPFAVPVRVELGQSRPVDLTVRP